MSLVHFLDRHRIITHPKPGPSVPCVTVSEVMWARAFTPRWVAVWRANRTVRVVYPTAHGRMHVISAIRTKHDWDRYHTWTVTYNANCRNSDKTRMP
jgi:hypothetical protein